MPPKTAIRSALRTGGLDIFRHIRPLKQVGFSIKRVERSGPVGAFLRTSGPVRTSFDVPVDLCTSFVGIPYSRDDWNPLVQTLREYALDRTLPYGDSPLAALHAALQPGSWFELFLGHAPVHGDDVLVDGPVNRAAFRYVWDVDLQGFGALRGAARSSSYYFGPIDATEGESEFQRLVTVFESIRKHGYRAQTSSPVTGYFVADDHSCRFVIGSGNHRVAALAALGQPFVPVRLHSHPAVVHRRQLDSWTRPRGGPFSPQAADDLFELFLTGSGIDRASRLGLA